MLSKFLTLNDFSNQLDLEKDLHLTFLYSRKKIKVYFLQFNKKFLLNESLYF